MKNPVLNCLWLVLGGTALAVYAWCIPAAEFTSDDGSWLLDAWLRLKEHDWFTAWVVTSQGGKNSPLVSWLLMLPLLVHASVTSVLVLVVGLQLATLAVIRKIALKLGLPLGGLLAGALFVFLPPLALNYSLKTCNISFEPLPGALLLWAYFSFEGKRRWVVLTLLWLLAVQVHYAYVIFLAPALLLPLVRRLPPDLRPKISIGLGLAAALLLLWPSLGLTKPDESLLRSFADLLATSAGYMPARSVPVGAPEPLGPFLPWELFPLVLCLILAPRRFSSWQSPRAVVWSVVALAIPALGLVSWCAKFAPHHWPLPWVVPALLLLELGLVQLQHIRHGRRLALAVAGAMVLACVIQLVSLRSYMITTGGTGWHGPSLTTKRAMLAHIAKTYPDYEVKLTTPGSEWTGSLVGWNLLASLPGEFLGQVASGKKGTLAIEERGTYGVYPEFAKEALPKGFRLVHEVGLTKLWLSPGPLTGPWPTVRAITQRRPSAR